MRSTVAGVSLRLLLLALAWVACRRAPDAEAGGRPSGRDAAGHRDGGPGPASVRARAWCSSTATTATRWRRRASNERPKPHVGLPGVRGADACARGRRRTCASASTSTSSPTTRARSRSSCSPGTTPTRRAGRIHKRVCKSHEWTLACEGPDRLPYPYGYVRDSKACHIDEIGPMIDEKRFYSVDKEKEIERIDRREPSGARPGCVSAYGVYDLTGNIDEWTTNETGIPDHGTLKGGNWGEWRNACRPRHQRPRRVVPVLPAGLPLLHRRARAGGGREARVGDRARASRATMPGAGDGRRSEARGRGRVLSSRARAPRADGARAARRGAARIATRAARRQGAGHRRAPRDARRRGGGGGHGVGARGAARGALPSRRPAGPRAPHRVRGHRGAVLGRLRDAARCRGGRSHRHRGGAALPAARGGRRAARAGAVARGAAALPADAAPERRDRSAAGRPRRGRRGVAGGRRALGRRRRWSSCRRI